MAWRVVGSGYTNTAQVPRDNDLYYRCGRCGDAISSAPRDNVDCSCYAVSIDKDYHRLSVDDFALFEVIQRPGRKQDRLTAAQLLTEGSAGSTQRL